MNELFNVKDKVVVITGGAGILGKGIAAYLAKEGAKVVVEVLSQGKGAKVVNFKYKPKTGNHRKKGHRQLFTEIKVTAINA